MSSLLLCAFDWFIIQSIEHHPLVISSLSHALFLQPQQVSMQICFAIDIYFQPTCDDNSQI
jgi:hypothetical protein